MRSEAAIYKSDYLQFTFETSAGQEIITFDNHEVRGDVEYGFGFNTKRFTTETGQTSIMSENTGKYVKFEIDLHRLPGTRYKYHRIQHITRGPYTCQMIFPYLYHDMSSEPSNPIQIPAETWGVSALTFSNCVFEISDQSVDQSARGEGAIFTTIGVSVYENNSEIFEIRPDYLAGDYSTDYKIT